MVFTARSKPPILFFCFLKIGPILGQFWGRRQSPEAFNKESVTQQLRDNSKQLSSRISFQILRKMLPSNPEAIPDLLPPFSFITPIDRAHRAQ